ncbi:GNAT family N-acetyltransferase [Nocardioides korecus]
MTSSARHPVPPARGAPRLVLPHVGVRRSFLAAMAEFAEEGRRGDDSMVGSDLERHGATWSTPAGFSAYVDAVLAERETPRQEGFVTSTTWWWCEHPDGPEPEYLGRIAVRHVLTERLREVGGHVGYDVRRSRRREGHATAMLAAVLPHAHALGIDPALVTCDVDNVASRRVIEACAGVLEDQRGVKLRFWVPTSPSRA